MLIGFDSSKISARDDETLTAADIATLTSGPLAIDTLGQNLYTPTTNGCWVGDDGDYTNNVFNNVSQDLILVLWGPGYATEFFQNHQPELTLSIPMGQNRTFSCAENSTGAWGALYDQYSMRLGMINNTIGEFSFNRTKGAFDVSREPNMFGHGMSIVGPDCTSDFDHCFFQCIEPNAPNCYQDNTYELVNCTGPDAQNGTTPDGQPSGGCGWPGVGVNLITYLLD